MHAKTDSEDTSLAPSSPDHNRRPVYYVQSPSRDSHDGEKTTMSFHSTPVLSPTGSPPHSSVGHHSRESSSTRFSGSLKPGSRKITPNDAGSGAGGQGRKGQKPWKECDVIEEEGLLEEDRSRKPLPRCCYTITFESFAVQAGSDHTGVGTDMISLNSTVKFLYRNTATFFGVHVTSSPVDLSFSEITIGSGTLKKFYQSRKSQRTVAVSVVGNKIPLYGSGASLSTPTGTAAQPVSLKLSFVLKSRAYVLGKLVKPKFNKKIECSIVLNPSKLNHPISLKNACEYD
nr:Late embryogenesis abundant protein, LEA-14 [Ipomoea batatas]